jgi:hypothetical protein
MGVSFDTDNPVFHEDGHLTTSWHSYFAIKSTEHKIQPPPLPQTMYVDEAMVPSWTTFFQIAQALPAIGGEAPLDRNFTGPDNKINQDWANWLQRW